MKKYLLLGLSAIALAACGNSANNQAESENNGSATVNESSSSVGSEKPKKATEVGEKGENENYSYTLMATANPEETLQIADEIELTFNSIDIITIDEFTSDEGKFLSEAYDLESGDSLAILDYKMSSAMDVPITGINTPNVVTSSGEQISDNYVTTEGAYELQPEATANSIFVVYGIDDAEIDGLTINFDIYTSDDKNEIYEQVYTDPIEVSFN